MRCSCSKKFKVLKIIYERSRVSRDTIKALIQMSPGALSYTLWSLEKEGLIYRPYKALYAITDKGKVFVEECLKGLECENQQ